MLVTKQKTKTLRLILSAYLVCLAAEYIEFLLIRTDQTFLRENLLCKAVCLLALVLLLRKSGLGWADVGFRKKGLLRGALFGCSLGAVTFAASYLAEFCLLWAMGKAPSLRLFITNFSLDNPNAGSLTVQAVLLCIGGNIVNVWAEEGLFRGAFLTLGQRVFSLRRANLLQAALFGLWHVVTVMLWVLDGSITLVTALWMAAGYVLLAGVLAYEWGLCAALTGTLWTGVFEHFFNNFIGNTLHTVTDSGVDELQIVRIVLSNLLSLAIVLCIARRKRRKTAPARR